MAFAATGVAAGLTAAEIAAAAAAAEAAAVAAASAAAATAGTAAAGTAAGGLLGAGAGAAGAGAGATGAGLLGAAEGGAAASSGAGVLAADGTTQAGLLAAQESGAGVLGSGNLGYGGATTGVQGSLNSALGPEAGAQAGGFLSDAGGYLDTAKKIYEPVSTGVQVAQAFQPPPEPQLMPSPIAPQQNFGPQSLADIAGQGPQQAIAQQQFDMAEKERRRRQIAGVGGLL